MRLTKIYTKLGDKGTTQLAYGERVQKDNPRIEAYGTIDELNSFIGLLRDRLGANEKSPKFTQIIESLWAIQHEMHDLGGELATKLPEQMHPNQSKVTESDILRLETEIDSFNEQLRPLANFVLPGGHELNSLAHICRTICRRAERRVFSLTQKESIRPEVPVYLNRLSDWFFVLGRVISQNLGVDEILWDQSSLRSRRKKAEESK
jgi:cob(I)alamin adenosyltransferase